MTEFRTLALDCIEGLKAMENHNDLLQMSQEILRKERDTAQWRAKFEENCGDECEEEKYEVQRYWARTQLLLNKMTAERDELKNTVAKQSAEIESLKKAATVSSPSHDDLLVNAGGDSSPK